MRRRSPRQLELKLRTHGGARKGAGRKVRTGREGFVSHLSREPVDGRHPLHITLNAAPSAPNLRSQVAFPIIRLSIEAAVRRGHRILHFSVQTNHVHLVMEVADDDVSVGRRMQRFSSRVAQLINMMLGRKGALWRDRYHRQDIRSPRQMKHTLVYVLFNSRKHGGREQLQRGNVRALDPYSSMRWFEDWDERARPPPDARAIAEEPSPLARATTWIARTGWKIHGLIPFDAAPASG